MFDSYKTHKNFLWENVVSFILIFRTISYGFNGLFVIQSREKCNKSRKSVQLFRIELPTNRYENTILNQG